MIEWLLQRLEIDPSEAFSERDLRDCDADGFAELRRERLLRRDPIPHAPFHRVVDGRSVIFLEAPDGDRVGLDPDDPESDPIEFEEAASWRLHMPTVIEGLRQLHRLAGPTRQLDERLHLIGERALEDRRGEAWVLAFLVPGSEAVTLLAGLPLFLGDRYELTRVVCPSFRLSPNDAALLRTSGITVGPLRSPAELPPAQEDGWSHSTHYDSITWDGRTRVLTRTEASVVKALDEARLGRHPVLSLRELAEITERTSARRLAEFFSSRNRDLIGTLVLDEGRGQYRLNVSHPPN
ncbi:MAG: hypothetical protein AB7I38_13400 [Dehalococcoidia bacterium]